MRVQGATVTEVGPSLRPSPGAEVIDGHGGALIPGLHDHHIHLLATAAAARSVVAGPPEVRDERALAATLRRADAALAPGAWIRAVGYHESVAGDLDRHDLDRLVPRRPVRVQHRSGARWVLNSVAVDSLSLDHHDHNADRSGIERDAAGRPTGRLHRADGWLRHLLPREDPPDLAALGRRLARFGVTAVTDTTPYTTLEDLAPLTDAVALVLALTAWDEAGSRPGDRIEHGAVIPDDQYARIARHGLTVVTQPGFVAERGDDYLRDVDPDDRPHLYPCASLIDRGIAVAGSTDAPYTHLDPWRAVDAARTRTTATGTTVGAREAVGARRALDLFLGSADAPGGPPRTVTAGSPADLCLLTVPLGEALRNPREVLVGATVVDGRIVP